MKNAQSQSIFRSIRSLFIFPIEREQQQVIDVIANVTIFIGSLKFPILGTLVGLLEVLVQLDEWWADSDMLDLELNFPKCRLLNLDAPPKKLNLLFY